MVSEIAAASSEQAQGIEQVNKAVTEMGQVTQQNAASAEESASASEEMSAQGEQMQGFVRDLVSLVDGHHQNNASATVKPGVGQALRAVVAPYKKVKADPIPAHAIPLDDKDTFSDF